MNIPTGYIPGISEPRIEIIEQPDPIHHRWRYRSEADNVRSIVGFSTNEMHTSHVKIRIAGLRTAADITVSCVTIAPPYKVHPHELTRAEKGSMGEGVIRYRIMPPRDDYEMINYGILMSRKDEYEEALQRRKHLNVDPFNQGYDHYKTPDYIDIYAIRLCFEARVFDITGSYYVTSLEPVVTWPIVRRGARNKLNIVQLDPGAANLIGNTRLQIWGYNKLSNDIKVKFSDRINCDRFWEIGITPLPRQEGENWAAVTVITPQYCNPNLGKPIYVHVELVNSTTGETGAATMLYLLPLVAPEFPIPINTPEFNRFMMKTVSALSQYSSNQVCRPHKVENRRATSSSLVPAFYPPQNQLSTHINTNAAYVSPAGVSGFQYSGTQLYNPERVESTYSSLIPALYSPQNQLSRYINTNAIFAPSAGVSALQYSSNQVCIPERVETNRATYSSLNPAFYPLQNQLFTYMNTNTIALPSAGVSGLQYSRNQVYNIPVRGETSREASSFLAEESNRYE